LKAESVVPFMREKTTEIAIIWPTVYPCQPHVTVINR
jgi:hypothetical protein